MARQKKPVHRVQMSEGKQNIIQTAEDIQDALKDLLGGTIKEMMEAEMDDHLGYNNHYDQKGQGHTCPWFHFKFHFFFI